MRKAYGKRRWVPDCCPDCGAARFVAMPPWSLKRMRPVMYMGALSGLLKVQYSTWKLRLRDYPSAPGLRCWWGECSQCMFTAELYRPSTLFSRNAKDTDWQGGTILIPLRS